MTETLAQYTELMLFRRAHGFQSSLDLVKVHLDQYLSARGYGSEKPLVKVDLESPHLAYNKGMVVMYHLEQMLGESTVNKALRSFFQAYAYPQRPPTSRDLMDCLYQVAPKAKHGKIKELFEQVVSYDAKVEKAHSRRLCGTHYEVSFTVLVQKIRMGEKGQRIPLASDPIIEIGVETADGKLHLQEFPVIDGKVEGALKVRQKPTKVIVDPLLKNLETFPRDNEKTVG
jgi:ABC-2 type transport system permease protein